jgi:hypothetical protein
VGVCVNVWERDGACGWLGGNLKNLPSGKRGAGDF